MKNKNLNAFPVVPHSFKRDRQGMTKHEFAAITIAAGMMVGRGVDLDKSDQETIAFVSFQIADKILKRTERSIK
jgi:hypothetical protein